MKVLVIFFIMTTTTTTSSNSSSNNSLATPLTLALRLVHSALTSVNHQLDVVEFRHLFSYLFGSLFGILSLTTGSSS